ncbi:MAG: hypothetical protein RMM53_09425 [Bacteroidia bacterium]|nr:hypothetical protein [Bacteroidia bacterium]MDW8334421.1 hypothetical protein [Bacteroidia bacterium]
MWLKSVVVGGERVDIRIARGRIAEVGTMEPEDEPTHDFSHRTVFAAPGFVAFGVGLTAPGREYREPPENLAQAAASGGFTDVVLVADDNEPFPDNAAVIAAVRQCYASTSVEFHVAAAATVGGQGTEMAELYDLHAAGARAFFDGYRPGLQAPILMRILQYLKPFAGLVVQTPLDGSLAGDGMVGESPFTVRLGLRTIPDAAETVFVKTALELLRYTGGRLHLTALTQADAQAAVRAAAAQGADVTYDLTPHHYRLCDQILAEFDANAKIYPPLKSSENLAGLQESFWADEVGFFSVQHLARTLEEKEVEFVAAHYGALSLETAAGATFEAAKQAQWERRWSHLPRRRFGLPEVEIRPGFPAKITLYEIAPVRIESFRSNCANSPYRGMTLPIRIVATING